jgi:hypothetical protein
MSFEEMESILQGILISQQQMQSTVERAAQVADSNGRAIQAMLDNAATDRLQHEERMQRIESLNEENNRRHEERMARLESISLGLVNLSSSIDEDRPTILRLLNSHEQKLDSILDRLPPQQQ